MYKRITAITFVALALISCLASARAQTDGSVDQEVVKPSAANPEVQQFDDENVVLTPIQAAPDAPLVVFFSGTHGKPLNALELLNVAAKQGYRVIGLTYDDLPAGTELCPRDPNPDCFAHFHEMRVFGRGPAPVSNPLAETIEARLTSLLRYLQREHPDANWEQYLTQDGHPRWSRILVSGLSQGAGMAAYIAKSQLVYRVVLFSSPWDNTGRDHRPAQWLFGKSVTPPDRWWAERHVQENTTDWIANAYRALRIPSQHVLLFNQGLTGNESPDAKNPYHGSTIRNSMYRNQWRVMYGSPQDSDNHHSN